jgi:hypothetical protein
MPFSFPSRLYSPAFAILAAVLLFLLNALLFPTNPGRVTAVLLMAYPVVALLLGGALRITGSNFGAALLIVTVVFLIVLFIQYGIVSYIYIPVYLLFAGIGIIAGAVLKKPFERNAE